MIGLCLLLFSFAWADPSLQNTVVVYPSQDKFVSWGGWETSPKGLYLKKGRRGKGAWNIWVPNGLPSKSINSEVSAVVTRGTNTDLSLLTRVHVGDTPHEGFSGYGLTISGGKLSIERWDGGLRRRISAIRKIRLPKTIRLVLRASGDQLHGMVYRHNRTELLYELKVRDSRWKQGRVGYRVSGKQGAHTILRKMTVSQRKGDIRSDPLYDIFGVKVFATVQDLRASKIPKKSKIQIIDRSPDGVLELLLPTRKWISQLQNWGAKIRSTSGQIPGKKYHPSYRQAKKQGLSITPTGVRLGDYYKDNELVHAILKIYAEKYPTIARVVSIGKTRQKQDIWALRVALNPPEYESESPAWQSRPMLLINGAHHGSELMSIEFVLYTMDQVLRRSMRSKRVQRWIKELDMWFVPLVNPDGNLCFWQRDGNYGRKNCWDQNQNQIIESNEGVDLNRNYPFRWNTLSEKGSKSWPRSSYYRGPAAGSEPETQAIMKLANRYHPAAVVSWHTVGTVILSPYTIDNVNIPKPDFAWQFAQKMLNKVPQCTGKDRKTKIIRKMYSVDGVDQDWHFFSHGSLAYIIEGPWHNPPLSKYRPSMQCMYPIMENLLQLVSVGHRISGQVFSHDGQPLQAHVEVTNIKLSNGEKWRSRAFDGRFDRLLPRQGVYHLKVSKTGYQSWMRTIHVKGPTMQRIVLQSEN